MKEIVLDRLNKMEDLEQRRLLKQMMTGVFLQLVEYQEEMNRKLEERVFNEITGEENKQDVYVTLCSREDVDPIHDFLFPMIPGDVKRTHIDMKSLVTQVSLGEEVTLLTVFMQCDHHKIAELANSRRTFSGKMTTSSGTVRIEVRLQPNRAYLDEIEKLYHAFRKNGLPWRTVNHPYARKFFDVILVRSEKELREDEEITDVSIHLEELEPYKKIDIIPLWNIERLTLKNTGFPVPAMDRINYEHVLSLRKTGTEHGYLVDACEEMIRYIKRTPEELIIVSPKEKSDVWDVVKITQPVSAKIGKMEYPLATNKRNDSFISGYAGRQAVIVRAKGEIARIIHSFEASRYLELVEIEIKDRADQPAATYEMNPFLSDNVRVDHGKKIMRLRFGKRGDHRFILPDIMSFLVSEVQLYFPEYRCEGEWA